MSFQPPCSSPTLSATGNPKVQKGFEPLDFRYLALTAHYRSKLNFTFAALDFGRSRVHPASTPEPAAAAPSKSSTAQSGPKE